MDVHKLIRSPSMIHRCIKQVDNTLVCTYPFKVYVPEKYFGTSLGSMVDDVLNVIGIFGLVVDDKYYAVSKALALMSISPSTTRTELIDNVKYMVFEFEKNDTFVNNTNLVKNASLVGVVEDEFFKYGKIPWYFTLDDLCSIFDTSVYHGGVNLKSNQAIIACKASIMARSPDDKLVYFRHINTEGKRPAWIGFSNIAYTTTNTTTRLFGNYYSDGVTSALVNESTENEAIEDILR